MRTKTVLLLGVFVCLSGVGRIRAQEVTGNIVGTVKDASGGAVPGATITLTNTDKNVVMRTVTTDSSGQFSAPLLPIGHYSITAEGKGFKKAIYSGLELNVNDSRTIDFILEVGTVQQTVTVEAAAVNVDLQTPTAAGLITGTQVRELAVTTRNFVQLTSLMPGVSTGFVGGDQLFAGVSNPFGTSNQINVSINGNRPTQNNWTIDGADNVDRGANLTLLNFPSLDSIAEFKVLRGQYNPEFGRSSSGQINVITRSGSSSFHGGLYEFFRNDVLDANSFINNRAAIPRPPLRYNDFGGTLGGPIYIPDHYNTDKNKTFFFFSEEARRVITYTTFTATVPNSAQRSGHFATPVCIDAPACTQTTKDLSGMIDPAAAAYVKDIFSKLSEPDASDLTTAVGRNVFNFRQEAIRVDHIFSSRFSVFGRFENDSIPTTEPGGIFTGSGVVGVPTTSTNAPGRNFELRSTMAFTPALINEAGYAYSYGAVVSNPIGLGSSAKSPDVISAITLRFTAQIKRVPNLSFHDFDSITGFGPYRDFNRNHQWFDNLTRIVGRHTMKFGFTAFWYQKSENSGNNGNNGVFNIISDKGTTTTNPLDQNWANFLLGKVDSFQQASVDFRAAIRQRQFEMYGQDEFRFRSNLTLTYGVRWSLFRAPTDANGQATSFDPKLYNPANAPQINGFTGNLVPNTGVPLNGVIIGGKNSPFGKAVNRQSNGDFAPRIGLAWDPFKTGKTSVRAGYGIFFDSPAINSLEQFMFTNPPFVSTININSTNLDNPGSVAPTVNLSPPFLGGPAVNWRQPYTQEWSLDIQREIRPNLLVDIGYFGNKGTHLVGVIDINEPQPGAYVMPLAPFGVKPPITSKTTPQLNFIRPFQGFDAINIFTPAFGSNYHSLQASLQKRFSGSSLVGINYTYSHDLTDAQSDFRTPQNSYNLHADYGSALFDRRHIFNADFVYELPWMRNQEGAVGHLVGGWEFSGIVYYYSGLPLTVTGGKAVDPAGLGLLDPNSFAGRRPDRVSDPNSGAPHTFLKWFNTGAFADIPAGQIRPGDSPRGAVRGPGTERWDVSLFKNIKMTESTRLQFRAEAFNIFNHTNFDTVRTTLQSSTFGRVLSVRDPRILQLALKFNF